MALSVPPPHAQIAGCIWLPRLLAKARQFLSGEMEKFLFGGDAQKPEGYKPPEAES